MLHPICIILYRGFVVVPGRAKASSFRSDIANGPAWYQRLNRSHHNCVENLILFAAIVLTPKVMGIEPSYFPRWCEIYLVARLAQSTTHLISEGEAAVQIRTAFFVTQLVVLGRLCYGLFTGLVSKGLW